MISKEIDWEQFVYVASDYLVLTTCYCRLKQKELLKHLPEDLELYLGEITNINKNRNRTLLKEIRAISDIFTNNKINHVFLKGSALLVKNHYQDLGERMLGDIDVLVDEVQLKDAYQLLLDYEYTGTAQGIGARYFNHKHLPRLQSKSNLAAVEVHKKVLLNSYKGILDTEIVLQDKECIEGIYVPSNKHLIYHSILNFQANDSGFVYSRISFKSIYDLITLKKTYDFNFDNTFKPAYFKNYFSIAKIFFNDLHNFKSKPLLNYLFILKLKYPTLRKIVDYFLEKIQFLKLVLTSRIWLFFKNKNYRSELFKDYKRILGF
ncbi:nucleotidyltransferase family protein [Psychroserpens sp.]|uniref:nucleotidyltransferase family protein n=1 Tax=Psychroserpens sp. TaxID=2020870 RepID=UPI00385CB1EC